MTKRTTFDAKFPTQASTFFNMLVEHWQPAFTSGESIQFAIAVTTSSIPSLGVVCQTWPAEYHHVFFERMETENVRWICIGEKEIGDRLCGQPDRPTPMNSHRRKRAMLRNDSAGSI